jgi:crotonobetainyl-CoA:carnitine CoA-transferase CaiB-like acyl-CoA transferase
VIDIPRPDGSTVSLTRNPIRLSRTPPHYRSAPPRLAGAPADPL